MLTDGFLVDKSYYIAKNYFNNRKSTGLARAFNEISDFLFILNWGAFGGNLPKSLKNE